MSPANDAITTFKVNFAGVRSGGGFGRAAHVTPGDYLLELMEAEVRVKKGHEQIATKAQTRMVRFVWRIVGGGSVDSDRGTLYENAMLQMPDKKPEEYLWKLRGVLEALAAAQNKSIPDAAVNVDLKKYKGVRVGALVDDDEPYEGKERSQVVRYYPAAEFTGEMHTVASASAAADDDDEGDTEVTPAAAGEDAGDDDDDDLAVEDL